MRNLATFLLVSLGILASAELTVILTTVRPTGASSQELWVFFISVWLVGACWGSLLWHRVKSRVIYRVNPPSLIPSARQAFLASAVITLCLFFSSLGILSPWDILPLAVAVILIEFFFQAEKAPPASRRHEVS